MDDCIQEVKLKCMQVPSITAVGHTATEKLTKTENLTKFCLFVLRFCLFVLKFYGPVNPMGSIRARSVYLTTRFRGHVECSQFTLPHFYWAGLVL